MALVVGKNGAHLEPAAADADALAAREASAPGGRGLYTGTARPTWAITA